jgi:hypothetical protein
MLNENTKDKLKELCFETLLSCRFGDGQNEEYIMNGVQMIGLNEMSDEELIQEYEQIADEDDELLIKAKLELDINTALSKQA